MDFGKLFNDLLDSAQRTGETFGVNWPLFLSNVISFLLVCWLLNMFAYKPVLKMLEARRQRIAEGLANAEQIKRRLAATEAQHAKVMQQANEEAQKVIEEARAAAETLAQKREQQAVIEADGILRQAREAIALERDRMLADLRREVARLVVDTTGKVTGKVLTTEDQRRLSEEAAREMAA